MNLKNQLKSVKKENQRFKTMKGAYSRSKEDWDIINDYLKWLFQWLVKKDSIIEDTLSIDVESYCMIFPSNYKEGVKLTNGDRLRIEPEDMQFFCKFHNLKLKFLIDRGRGLFESKYYIKGFTYTYLIEI